MADKRSEMKDTILKNLFLINLIIFVLNLLSTSDDQIFPELTYTNYLT